MPCTSSGGYLLNRAGAAGYPDALWLGRQCAETPEGSGSGHRDQPQLCIEDRETGVAKASVCDGRFGHQHFVTLMEEMFEFALPFSHTMWYTC